jgi:hypothetical protein
VQVVRKSIARVLTVYNQTQKSKLREVYGVQASHRAAATPRTQ